MPKTPCPANDTAPNANSLIERITKIQDRAMREGFISDGKDSKSMMDAKWGEPDLEADRSAFDFALESQVQTANGVDLPPSLQAQ